MRNDGLKSRVLDVGVLMSADVATRLIASFFVLVLNWSLLFFFAVVP